MATTTLETAVRARIRAAMGPSRVGGGAGLAAGLVVGAAVAETFLSMGDGANDIAWMVLPLSAVAFLCTGFGAWRAIGAETTGKAVGWVVASNVLPPTLICLPTIVGVIFSFPAGLIAAATVLPFVLVVRKRATEPTRGREARERILSGAMAAFGGLVLLGWQLFVRAGSSAYAPSHPPALFAPVVVSALGALALAGSALLVELRNRRLVARIERGEEGLRIVERDEARVEIEQIAETGAGPHRRAETRDLLGTLPRSRRRWMAALSVVTTALLVLAASITFALV